MAMHIHPSPDVDGLSQFPNPSATNMNLSTGGFAMSSCLCTEVKRPVESRIANIKASYAVAAEISPPWRNMAPKMGGRRELQVHGRHMIQATGSLMYDIPPNCALDEPSVFGRARVSYSSMGKSWPGYTTNQRQPRRQTVLATRRSTTSGRPRAAFMSQASLRLHNL